MKSVATLALQPGDDTGFYMVYWKGIPVLGEYPKLGRHIPGYDFWRLVRSVHDNGS